MSMYPVDFKNDKFWRGTMDKHMRKTIKKSKCIACGKKIFKGPAMWAYHAITFGYAWGEWWCSDVCCFGKKTVDAWKNNDSQS